MNLIGIAGKKRSGKDTVGKMIHELRPEMQLIAFADKLKQFCSIAYGIPIEWFYDDTLKEMRHNDGLSPRQAMTTVHDALTGVTNIRLWSDVVKAEWENKATHHYSSTGGMIITDVRFEWEAEWLVQAGGTILTVTRYDTDHKAGGHASELGLPDKYRNHVIQNNGSLEELRGMVASFMNALPERLSCL